MKKIIQTIVLACCMIVLTSFSAIAQTGTQRNTAGTSAKAPESFRKVKITAVYTNADVKLSGDGQYHFDYDKDKFTVTAAADGSVYKIKVTAKQAAYGYDRVTIFIPDQDYTLITGVAKKSGLSLMAADADVKILNKRGAVSVKLPSDYSKTLTYKGISGSGSVIMGGTTDFTVNAAFTACSVSVPGSWPSYSNGTPRYSYTSGRGTADIRVSLTGCSFSFIK